MPKSIKLFIAFIFLLPVPWLVVVIALSMLWYGVTRWILHNPVGLGLRNKLNAGMKKLAGKLLKDDRDYAYLYSFFGLGIFMPILFVGSWYYQTYVAESFNWWAVLAYQVISYGPYFVFFSEIATIIHKEGHAPKGMFKPGLGIFNKFYGYFMGFFYGHVAEAYPMGHLRIHHKYDNNHEDVTTTLPYDRTKASSWGAYLYDFALYWTGISIVQHFLKKKRSKEANKMMLGMLFFYGGIALVMVFDFWFGFAYLLVQHLSSILFLAAINYCWHSFANPNAPNDTYQNTITILKGQYNVYNEDYHVEHHLRPQTHWSEYHANFVKHEKEYREKGAIIFEDTQAFEVFFWILLKRYDKMANALVDLSGSMTEEDKIVLLKSRLQPALV